MRNIYSSVACNLDVDILSACMPLFSASQVEAIEWSFDALYKAGTVPEWFSELLQFYGKEQRLIGHGIFFSLFSGKWKPEQEQWLKHLQQVSTEYRFDHITEHFGFMTGRDFHHGAPLNIPYSTTTLAIGRDRLARIQDACSCPVGLENLAFSYSIEEVKKHGTFLEELIEPVNGFIILDLHNLYCQLHNFNIEFDDLLQLYPLHCVREIHISGGSWEDSLAAPSGKVRRDTHDDSVPDEVFGLLSKTLPKCPQLKFVVLEQIGQGLTTDDSRQQFQTDFQKMNSIVKQVSMNPVATDINTFLPENDIVSGHVMEDVNLHNQQLELSDILETSTNYDTAVAKLQQSSLAGTAWNIEQWTPYMLETAMQIAQKWKKR